MADALFLGLLFGFGVLIQAYLLLRGKEFSRPMLLLTILVPLIAFMPGKHEAQYSLLSHVMVYFMVFSGAFAIMFKKQILPVVGEETLLAFTIAFWAIYLTKFPSIFISCAIPLLIPTIGVLLISFSHIRIGFAPKLVLYAWFLFILLSIGLSQFQSGDLSFFLQSDASDSLDPVSVFFTGMTFLYIACNALYLFELIPIPGKHQSMEDRMRQWHEDTELMVSRYSDHDMRISNATVILVIESWAFALNFIFNVVPVLLLANIVLALVPHFVVSIYEDTDAGANARADTDVWD